MKKIDEIIARHSTISQNEHYVVDVTWLRERLEECLPCLEALRESNLERYGMFAASLQSLIVEITPTEEGK